MFKFNVKLYLFRSLVFITSFISCTIYMYHVSFVKMAGYKWDKEIQYTAS